MSRHHHPRLGDVVAYRDVRGWHATKVTASNIEAIDDYAEVVILEAAPESPAPWPISPMILVVDGERRPTGQPGDLTVTSLSGQILLRTPEGHYRGVRSRLVKQSRGDQIRKWVDLAAVEDRALRDLSEAAHNGPISDVSDAIQDVLTSADMVKDGRYLQ